MPSRAQLGGTGATRPISKRSCPAGPVISTMRAARRAMRCAHADDVRAASRSTAQRRTAASTIVQPTLQEGLVLRAEAGGEDAVGRGPQLGALARQAVGEQPRAAAGSADRRRRSASIRSAGSPAPRPPGGPSAARCPTPARAGARTATPTTGPAASTTTGRSAGAARLWSTSSTTCSGGTGAAGHGEGAQPLLQQVGVLAPQDPAEAAGSRREAGQPIVRRTAPGGTDRPGPAPPRRGAPPARRRPGPGGLPRCPSRDRTPPPALPAVGAGGGDRSRGARWRSARPRCRPGRWSSQRGRPVVGADGEWSEASGAVLAGNDDGATARHGQQRRDGAVDDEGQRACCRRGPSRRPPTGAWAWRARHRASAPATALVRWPSRHRPGCRPPSTARDPRRRPAPARARRRRAPGSAPARGSGAGRRGRPRRPPARPRAWPKAAKSSRSPQRPVRRPRSQVRRTVMRCSSVSLRATTCQWSVTGVPARTSSRATVQPTAVRTLMARSGSSAAGRRPATASVWSVESSPRTAPRPLGPASSSSVARRTRLASAPASTSTRRDAAPSNARTTSSPGPPGPAGPGRPTSGQTRPARLGPRRPLVGPLLLPPIRRRRTGLNEGRRPVTGRARRCVGPTSAAAAAVPGPRRRAARSGRTVVGTLPSAHSSSSPRACACTAPSGSGTSSARPGRNGPPSPRRARPTCHGRGPRRRRRRSRGSTTSSARPDPRAACDRGVRRQGQHVHGASSTPARQRRPVAGEQRAEHQEARRRG